MASLFVSTSFAGLAPSLLLVSTAATTTSCRKCNNSSEKKDNIKNNTKLRLANARLVPTFPCWYWWNTPNSIRFWLATIINVPRKNPTLNDVGNLFSTNVPKTARIKWTRPEWILANTSALLPVSPARLMLITACLVAWQVSVSYPVRSEVITTTNTTHYYLLSKMLKMKYPRTNKRLKPQARCTEPFGSPEQDANTLSIILDTAPVILNTSVCTSWESTVKGVLVRQEKQRRGMMSSTFLCVGWSPCPLRCSQNMFKNCSRKKSPAMKMLNPVWLARQIASDGQVLVITHIIAFVVVLH